MKDFKGLLTVEQCTSSEILVHHAVFCPPDRLDILAKAVIGDNAQHFTDFALLDQFPDLDAEGEVPGPDGLHQEQFLLLGRFAQDLRLRRVDGEGFLAEDMLACLQRKHGVLVVVGVRRGHIDDVDIGVLDELLVRAVCSAGPGDLGLNDELLRPGLG